MPPEMEKQAIQHGLSRITPRFLDSVDRFLASKSINNVFELSKVFTNISDKEIIRVKSLIECNLASSYVHQFKPACLAKHSFRPRLYRKGVAQPKGLIDFLLDLRNKSAGSRVIFLGEDGYEYLGPAFHVLSKGSIEYYSYSISRKHLATKAELIDLGNNFLSWQSKTSPTVVDLLKGVSAVESMLKIKRDSQGSSDSSECKIKLYRDLDNVMREAIYEFSGRDDTLQSHELTFDDRLYQGFRLLVSNPANRDVCIGLIWNLLRETDFDNRFPLIIVDYIGVTHVQSHLLQLIIRWLADPESWNFLSCSQKLSLTVDFDFFHRLNVCLHIGVLEGNPLSKIKGSEVFVNAPSVDLVETTRFWGYSDAKLADGLLSYEISNSFHISETLAKISIILQECHKRTSRDEYRWLSGVDERFGVPTGFLLARYP